MLLAATTFAPAAAQPAEPEEVVDTSTLSLPTLGLEPDISLYGLAGMQTVTFPVPAGLAPEALTAMVELPPFVRAGSIVVTQDNRTISRVDLPPDGAPVSIPLAGAEIVENAVTVLLRAQLLPVDDYCLYDPTIPLRLVDAALTYDGVEAVPEIVADFLPPVLEGLTIFLPENPSRAESDAAVRLTTAVVARYGAQNTDVDVEPLRGQMPASRPFERHIVVREGPDAGVSLQGADGVPALLISGSANDLVNQARLLGSDISRLALASKAVAGPIKSSPQLPADVTTIRDLGQPGVNATALKPQVSVGLDQTRLGRPVKDVRVHLKGSYTPLPAGIGGQIVVAIDGQTVDRWPIEPSGVINRWIAVPDDMLQRYTNLGVAVDISGNTGRCGEFQPVTLTIDGATVVESRLADPPAPAGFQSLPQAIMPRVLVGVGDGLADTRRAVTIVEGLQRLSALPIDAEVVPLDEARTAELPAVVVAPDGWDGPPLPVGSGTDNELAVQRADGEPTTLRLDPALRFGSLQTRVEDGRTVVVATSNGDAGQLDSLLAWLDADPLRWSRLSGVAVLAPAGQDPVTVPAEANPPASSTDSASGSTTVWVAASAVVAAAAALAGWLVVRRRRHS
jgi:hypothetical protein